MTWPNCKFIWADCPNYGPGGICIPRTSQPSCNVWASVNEDEGEDVERTGRYLKIS